MALHKGWALCLAEDGRLIGESLLSLVRSETFQPLSEDNKIALPSDLDVRNHGDLDARVNDLIAADRIWFVLVNDLRAARAQTRISGGPRSGQNVTKEKIAQDVIGHLHRSEPEARMVKADACIALGKAGFSRKATDRIWNTSAPGAWKVSGRPPAGMKRISPDDLLAALRRGGL